MKTIVDVAVADGRFKTLVAAVKAAKLDGALSGPAHLQYLHLLMMLSKNYQLELLNPF